MSTTVDSRVVEMRFDNRQFENNVQTSMSTLDKLKQKLNLSGASKGLEQINTAASKVDMKGLGNGVEYVSAKFSALQVMGVTALANITNSAVEAGKKMVSALTIDPVKDGLAEYETQMNAIQTILANTQDEGTNVKIVNKALDELNTYADKTIYNFTEMTRNIGTFTAAGVKLDASVSAIKGIANLAAVSGSTSQQASTAMYQLSQALAAGKVQLMDWNSVVNAGMGGKVFQNALIRTSELLGTGAKAAIEANGSFRESLTKTGWLTTEVLTQTLDQFSTAAETQQEYEAAVKKFVDQGYTEEEAKSIADMARTAGEAATKVKTFTQLIDTLKEALGSGWTKTWQLIIGDFEEAKELWTGISDVLGGFINKMSDARNKLLESALGKSFTGLAEKLGAVTEPAKKAVEAVNDLGDVVNKVIRGDFGNGQDRITALTEAGINFYKVQNKVNETLGNSHRYTSKQIEEQDKLLGSKGKLVEGTKEESKETVKLTAEKKNLLKKIASMTEEQMRSKGYTEEQIAAFKELGETADKLGMPINELIDNLDKITGRWLLINSFKNIGNSLVTIFKSIGDAWRSTFEAMSADKLFDIIAAFHKFTATIKNFTTENTDKLTRTFKGLFAVIDILKTIVGGGLSIAFKAISTVLGAFNLNILDLTAILGDAIVKFRDFLFDNDLINKGFELLAKGVKMAAEALKELYDYVSNLPKVQKFIENIKDIDLSEIGKNILEGLKNGLKDGVTSIPQMLIEIGKSLLEGIKGVLGIHSPSTEMYEIGQFSIEGLINGIKDGAGKVLDAIKDIGSNILEWVKGLDWSNLFAVGVSIGLLAMVKKMLDIVDNFSAPFAAVGDLISGLDDALSEISKQFGKVLKAKAFQLKAEAIRNLALSLLILAGAVYLLAQLDPIKLWSSIGAITVLAGVLIGLSFAMDKLATASATIDRTGFNLKGLRTGLIGIGVALLLMAATVKVMGSMNPDEMKRGFVGLAGIILAIAAVFASFGLLVKGKSAQNIDKAGIMLRKMAVTILLLVAAVKLIGKLSPEEMLKGAVFMGAFLIFVTALNAISLITGKNIDKIGGSIMKISMAMVLMVGVVKLVGLLSAEEMLQGAVFAGAFVGFVAALVAITKIGPDRQIAKLGGLLTSISFSMMLMVGVVKLVGLLSASEMLKGAVFAGAFLLFVKALIAITKIGPEEQMAKVAGTIIAMSVAIGILAGVCILLGLINLGALTKGIAAVGMLGIILSTMIKATKGAEDVKGSIIAMAIAIGVMAAAVVALSFIKPEKLAGATIALSILMGMFALMEKSIGTVEGAMGTLIVMTVAIALLAGALFALSLLDIKSTLEISASLGLLMMSLAGAMKIISQTGGSAMAAMPAVLAMSGVLAIIAIILGVLAKLDVGSTLEIAASLSLVMLSLAASMLIISLTAATATAAIPAMLAMSGVLIIVGAVLGVLAKLNVGPTLEIAKSLSLLLLSLSAACLIMAGAAAIATVASAGLIPMMALMVGMGALMAAIAGLVTLIPDLETFLGKALPILKLIGQGIGEFLGGIITGIGNAVLDLLPKLGTSLSMFMLGARPFLIIAQTVDSSVLKGVGYISGAILALTGANFIAAVGQVLSFGQTFADLGTQLSSFMINAMPFFSLLQTVDPETVEAANTLSNVILALTKSELMSGLSSFVNQFTGGSSLDTFGAQLVSFGKAVVDFSNEVKGKIDATSVEAAANAGLAMAKLADAIPKSDGFLQDIIGEKDLAKFGSMCKAFGKAIGEMSQSLTGENGTSIINEAAIKSAAKAGKAMSKLANSIPKKDGFLQDIVGEQDLAKFGATCRSFGIAIKAMSAALTGEDGAAIVNQDIVKTATTAGRAMIALQNAIPEEHWLDGKVSLDEFGGKISKFGKGIKSYSDEVADVDSNAVSSSISSANRLVNLTKRVTDLDTSGISNFKDVKSIGSTIKKYADEVGEIDTNILVTSITSANRLIRLMRSIVNLDTSGISNFKKVTGVGEAMKAYSSKVATINVTTVSVSVVAAERLAKFINSLTFLNTSGVSTFKNAVNSLAKTNISGLAKAFNGSTAKIASAGTNLMNALVKGFKSKQSILASTTTSIIKSMLNIIRGKMPMFKSYGSVLISNFVAGIRSQISMLSSVIKSALASALSNILSYYSSFHSAGSYLVDGFADGIDDNAFKAKVASKAMAKAAYDAAKDELDINSPSKVFRRLAYSVPEGFAQGIDRMGKTVEKSASGMAGKAIRSTEGALSKIADVINSDMDSQPTIRPVLDLSDVKNGASIVSDLFNDSTSVGVMANVNAVNSLMSKHGQNGRNDDVVSAIDNLRTSLSNIGGPTYTINGITYDDGSNISDAVETLVRAARIGRRV